MDRMQLFLILTTGTIGYLFGIAKDRSTAVRTKQIEAMTQLHERVLEIERKKCPMEKASLSQFLCMADPRSETVL